MVCHSDPDKILYMILVISQELHFYKVRGDDFISGLHFEKAPQFIKGVWGSNDQLLQITHLYILSFKNFFIAF